MEEGLSDKSMQARLIQGEGVPWLSVFMVPGFKGMGVYGKFPLVQPLSHPSLKAQLFCGGVFKINGQQKLKVTGFPLITIPEGGIEIIETTNMFTEPLHVGAPIPVRDRTCMSPTCLLYTSPSPRDRG